MHIKLYANGFSHYKQSPKFALLPDDHLKYVFLLDSAPRIVPVKLFFPA